MSDTGERTSVRRLYMKRTPVGEPVPEDYEVRTETLASPGEGEILVETHYLGLDAALRLLMRNSPDFLFRVAPGDPVPGTAAGRVLESRSPRFAAGDYVTARVGVASHGIVAAQEAERCDVDLAPLPTWLGSLGNPGLTAYFAIFEVCRPQPGQTVLVNGAAGAVGSMACQFAKLTGARVVGVAGGPEKCQWLVEALGIDAAIDYRDGTLYDDLMDAAPDRLDFVFDNVGGSVLDESLRWIAMHGTVLLCGSTSQYAQERIEGPSQYIWLGTMRARMQGFVVFDYADRFDRARRHIAAWIDEGRIRHPESRIPGDVGDFPQAFQQLYRGANRGKMLLKLPAAGS